MNWGAQIPINVEYFKRVWRTPQMITGTMRYVLSVGKLRIITVMSLALSILYKVPVLEAF